MNVFITKALGREQRTVRLTVLKLLLSERRNWAHRTSGLEKTSLGLPESPALHARGKVENKMELEKDCLSNFCMKNNLFIGTALSHQHPMRL